MKIFTNQDIRAIDRRTIESEGISARELIDRVAQGVSCEIVSRWSPSKRTVVFAGPGNNGADALATSRLLIEQGFNPEVILFNIGKNHLSADCRACRDELLAMGARVNLTEITGGNFDPPVLGPNDLVIDGLFGSGLREPLSGGFRAMVRYINDSEATVVSIDIPSGLFSDWNPNSISRDIIQATLTLAVQFPRLAFMIADNAESVGEWKVLDLGLSRTAIASTPTNFHLIEEAEVKKILRPRKAFSSKADYGSALMIAGSYGMNGAAIFAARGAVRAGAGKVTVHSAKSGFFALQTAVPEAMFDPDANDLVISRMLPRHEYTAEGVGPGIGTHEPTQEAFEEYLKHTRRPIVIDADALNILAVRRHLLDHLPVLSVLTPHAGEFDRIFDVSPSAEARLLKALEVSRKYNILILLKGRYSALVRPDGKVCFNASGSPALATPGSGDVLTGVIVGLMAQGYKPEVASLVGAYVHGLAGELAAETHGEYGVTASDIADNIGRAIKHIMKK
ncbi:MAG: NAD(P)H-hydrate dehydratase [Paramuribaculum sp.]|nr:NAD(P)H-hydrate dehydratase [Paramuribaculum sp.]